MMAALALLPVLAAGILVVLRPAELRRWIERGAGAVVLLLALALPWWADAPDGEVPGLFAALVAAWGLAGTVGGPARSRSGQVAGQLRLAGLLLALLPLDPLLTWLALALAASAGAATRLPRIAAVVRRLAPTNVAIGLGLFGVVALQLGAVPLGGVALLLAWATLAALEPALLPVVLLLALRLQAGTAALPHGGLVGTLMAGAGVAVVLAAAVHQLWRPAPRRLVGLLALAQAGAALCAFGLGGADLRFAGLLQVTLLTLSHCAVRLSTVQGLDRLAGLAGLAGLPPFGVFPSLALIAFGMAAQAPWLLLALVAGLVGLGWTSIRQLPEPKPVLQPGIAWVPLVLALILGIAMPAPIAGWFHALAAASP